MEPTKLKNKNRKIGRSGRTAKHRVGQLCSMKNCYKLESSRHYDDNLQCYMASVPSGRGR